MTQFPDDVVDLARYPLADDGKRKPFVEQCRAQLSRTEACVLPGFLKPAAIESTLANVTKVAAHAHQVIQAVMNGLHVERVGANNKSGQQVLDDLGGGPGSHNSVRLSPALNTSLG